MSKILTNLTLPSVIEVIEEVLETYPDHPYQQAFAIPDLHQKLVAFVLTRIQNVYQASDDVNVEESYADAVPFNGEERLCVESVIHQGIHTVFSDNPIEVQHQVPEEEQPGLMASHWFG